MTYPGTILKAFKILAKKELGQNFLADSNTAKRIVNLAEISSEDIVLEIGPGLGALTVHAAESARKVVAVEKDHRLIQHLKNELAAAGVSNVELINRDVLKVDIHGIVAAVNAGISVEGEPEMSVASEISNIPDAPEGTQRGDESVNGTADSSEKPLIVLGNLPYNISSQVLFKLAEHRHLISRAVLMFQKELAERICAPPGGRDYGRLSAVMQYCATVRLLTHVGANLFFPKPDVESTVIEVAFTKACPLSPEKERFLFKVIKAAFSKRRKTLKNSLSGGELKIGKADIEKGLMDAGIDPVRRAETLSVEEFERLAQAFWPYASLSPERAG